jgi:carboxypeptidase Taq
MNLDEIPRAWKEEMKNRLNVEVPSDVQGCLQDFSWYFLAFGYISTYLVGAATSAQLEHYFHKAIPDTGHGQTHGPGPLFRNEGMAD